LSKAWEEDMAAISWRAGARPQIAAEPNVIPFIDVLLVLLIIFMVTAPRPTTDFNVDMPGPGAYYAADLPPTIVHIRARNGATAIYVGDREVQRPDLATQVTAAVMAADGRLSADDARSARSARIFVRADLDIAYQAVIAVMDDLNTARFRTVSIVAQDADAAI
jgi:biopolymer transport protein ExbD